MKRKGDTIMVSKLEKRILDISYKYGLSHIGSCLTVVRMLDIVYQTRGPEDPVILSNGHAGLALYVILEKYYGHDAEELWKKHGTHPNRDPKHHIYCSTGSLGQGVPIGVGMALADRTRDVYIVTSDGELAEGSCWEALRVAGDLRLENLRVFVNANGYSAYKKLEEDILDVRLQYFYPTLVHKTNLFNFPDYLQGLGGHYHVLTKEEHARFNG